MYTQSSTSMLCSSITLQCSNVSLPYTISTAHAPAPMQAVGMPASLYLFYNIADAHPAHHGVSARIMSVCSSSLGTQVHPNQIKPSQTRADR
ncbi:predicted protein [Plenodomus lingam JN3]|uniref:Predicted protein n=1 Tax=Leptosphaeria maculans (strain JN3 / isolate v23.1.3 / race Av1-4-5-6-7-8) TaxID=985895 RepID=E4ZQ02_LEPMJ|nr:predicted protein [Plenodomus lingam JN3]CBX93537.1 predicted protein [Plenodomus lingam JN3]